MALGWLYFVVASTALKPSTQTDCLNDAINVVNASQTGVQIKPDLQKVNKCLIPSDEMFRIGDTTTNRTSDVAYKIIWSSKCSEKYLWKLTLTNNTILKNGKLLNLFEILQLHSDWRLDWASRADGWVIVYLIKSKNVRSKGFLIDRTDEACGFNIRGLNKGAQNGVYLLLGVTSTETVRQNFYLENITFAGSGPKHACDLETLRIDNGEIIEDKSIHNNTNKVLLGSTITFQCNPGYGVNGLNFTTVQEIECNRNARPRACLKIKSPSVDVEEVVIGIISLMVMLISVHFLIFCYCWRRI